MEDKLKRCGKCNLPETHETIDYNDQNVCNLCQSFDYKTQNISDTWEPPSMVYYNINNCERQSELDDMIEQGWTML